MLLGRLLQRLWHLPPPAALVKAHRALDKAVDLCYRPQPFPNETKKIEFLFELYDAYTSGLFVEEKNKKGKRVVGKKKGCGTPTRRPLFSFYE